jgi:gluconolactonase
VIFTTDLGLPEAPLLLPDGSWLVTEMAFDRGTVTQVSADGKTHSIVAHTGRPNGLALTADGAIWVCETLDPALVRLELSGALEHVVTSIDGVPLLWPNDVCVGPDGALYATDSGVRLRDFLDETGAPAAHWASLEYRGKVFRYDPATREAWFLDDGYQFTNGIAFGPDGLLYVNETMTGNVYRYRLDSEGRVVGGRELFSNVLDPAWTQTGMRGPDGMAFSEDGRLWCTVFGQGDVTVIGPDGGVTERIKLQGAAPTNIAFGRPGEGRIYVVEDEHGQMETYDVGVDGLALHV